MIRYKLTNGESDKVSLHVCVSEEHVTTAAAQERLSFLLSVLDTSSPQTPPPITRKAWTDAEIAVISRAISPADAYQKYRAVFHDSSRTEYSVIKKYGKLRREWSDLPKDDPEPTETERILAHHKDMQIAFVEPVSTGDEVTLHDPLPEQESEPTTPPTIRRNAWLPEEDDILREAIDVNEAVHLCSVYFPGKRTPDAIKTRMRTLFPTTLEKLKAKAKTLAPPTYKVGDRVRYRGKPGIVRKADVGAEGVLVVLDYNAGSVYTPPEMLELIK